MNRRNTTSRHGSVPVGLHWLMLSLIAAVHACIELRGNFPKGSDIREGLKALHFMLGLSVLAAAALHHHCVVRDNTLRRMAPGRT